MAVNLVDLTQNNFLVPPGLCPGYGPCGGGVYLGVAPTDPAQAIPSEATFIANTKRQTAKGSVHVPQNILFVGDVPMATVKLTDDKLYREEHDDVPPQAQGDQVVINIDQPPAGFPVPVSLRLVVNDVVRTVYIDPGA
jgi:hypothetical protein